MLVCFPMPRFNYKNWWASVVFVHNTAEWTTALVQKIESPKTVWRSLWMWFWRLCGHCTRFTGICKVGPDTALNCGSSIARKLHGSQLLGTLSGTDVLHNILIAIRWSRSQGGQRYPIQSTIWVPVVQGPTVPTVMYDWYRSDISLIYK